MLPVMYMYQQIPTSSPLLPTGAWHKVSGEKEYLLTSELHAFRVPGSGIGKSRKQLLQLKHLTEN